MTKVAVVLCVLAVQLFGALAASADNWKLVPDESGRLRLINTNPYEIPAADDAVEPLFNPETDVIFRLFTRRNPAHGQILSWNSVASVQSSNFVASHPTRFTIHGWNGGETSGLHANIRQNYLGVGEFNVIAVDWGVGAQTVNYIAARNRVASVGDIISRMVNTIVSASGTSRNNIYLIGHSLGAHAAGNAGRLQNGQLNTIVGLDPAGPLFSLGDSDIMGQRDAQYTEAIFTNAGLLGFDLPLSDANFYPNGGRSQPGCGIDVAGNCAHSRAHELFAESVSSSAGFRATRCASHGNCTPSGADANMGGEPSNYGRGVIMESFALLALLVSASVVSSDDPCGSPGWVAVPRDPETFECLTAEDVNRLQHLERSKRFDAEAATRFFLWTQHTADDGAPEELRFADVASLQNSTFDVRNPTRLLVHGWLSDWKSDAVRGLSRAYSARGGAYNVIGVDWSAGASTIVYVAARMRVAAVAGAIAAQIGTLLQVGQHPSQIAIVGHSLGAHVAGLTGKHFQGDSKLAAIVALDPAGPLFGGEQRAERVDALDAQYVEVIHTNKGLLGHRDALGQADFYPNGGRSQPGCLTNSCSHNRAVEYFHRSLVGDTGGTPLYVGRRCATTLVNDRCHGAPSVMGSDPSDDFKTKMSGLFYLAIDK
uniref:Lipase domain-containing protein n=1 Tax=Anopheles dirus TaxID=7168 RepID=A0A182N2H5_9DIPT